MNPNAIGIYLMLAILMIGAVSLGQVAVYVVGGLAVVYAIYGLI